MMISDHISIRMSKRKQQIEKLLAMLSSSSDEDSDDDSFITPTKKRRSTKNRAIGIDGYDGKVDLFTTRRHSLSDLADLVQASSTTAEKSRYVRYNYSRCLSTPLHREIMFMLHIRVDPASL